MQSQQDIEDLQRTIDLCDEALIFDENDANAHNLKGQASRDLAILTNNQELNYTALQYMSNAVNLDPENVFYLSDRAKLYSSMKQTNNAVQDFKKLQELSIKQKGQDILKDLEVRQTLEELTSLLIDSSDTKCSIEDNHIPSDVEKTKLIHSAAGNLANRMEATAKDLTLLNEIFKRKLTDHEGINNHIVNNESRQAQQSKGSDIRNVSPSQEVLQLTEITEKTELIKLFKVLKKKDPQLYKYSKTFYWAALNLLIAYTELSTGILKLNINYNRNEVEEMIKNVTKKTVSMGFELLQGPSLGDEIFVYMDTIIDIVMKQASENKINIINKIIQNKFSIGDKISVSVARLSLIMAKNSTLACKIKTNFFQREVKPSLIEKICGFIQNKVDRLKTSIWESLEDKDDSVTTQAIQDVAFLLSYFCVNSEDILNNPEPLEIQVEAIVKDRKMSQMIAQLGGDAISISELQDRFLARNGKKSPESSRHDESTEEFIF